MFKIGELRRRLLPSFAFVRSFPHPATKRLISFGIIAATNRSKKRFKEAVQRNRVLYFVGKDSDQDFGEEVESF